MIVEKRNFKKDVNTLYFVERRTVPEIADLLAESYGISKNTLGRSFTNFKSRIGMCVLRTRRSLANMYGRTLFEGAAPIQEINVSKEPKVKKRNKETVEHTAN